MEGSSDPRLQPDLFVVPLQTDLLVEWAHENGATLDPKVEVYQGEYGTSLRVKRPKGLTPASPLPPNSSIVSCSYGISLSYLNALDEFSELPSRSPPMPKQFLEEVDPHTIGRFFLMQQYLLGEQSFWAPYIESLPQPDEAKKLATPLFWDDEALECLKGTNIAVEVVRRKMGWSDQFKVALQRLTMVPSEDRAGNASEQVSATQTLFKEKATVELYLWACTIFSSRSFPSHLIPVELYGPKLDEQISQNNLKTWRDKMKSEGPYAILLPLLDIANHSPTAKVEWFVDAKAEKMSISIKNDDEVPIGQQIFNNYAPKGNSELLLGYGFILPNNDDYLVKIRCPPNKLAIRKGQSNYNPTEDTAEGRMFAVRRQPFPGNSFEGELKDFGCFEPGLIDLLCLLVTNEREEEFWGTDGQTMSWTVENSSDFMETVDSEMGRALAEALALLKGRMDVALAQLKATSPSSQPSSTQNSSFTEVALAYRGGQVQTIQKAIDTLNDFLNPLVCSKDEKELQEPTWPQNPIISLTTACDFFLNYMGAEHLWIPFKEHLPYVNDIPEDVEYHRCSSVPQTCMNHAKKIGKLDEFYDIFWAMWVWHILCIWGSRQNDLPDPLTAWADHMLGCYNIRPVPDENDETWQHLKGMVETLPEMFYSTPYIGHSLAWEKYFHPQEKSVEALIKRKPRCKPIQGESGEKWEERSTKDYWLKTAMIALKIARGEVIRDGLSGLIPVGGKNYLPEVDNEDEDMPQHRKLKPENRFYFEEITNDRAALYVQRFHLPEGEKTQREKTQEYLESTGEGEEDY